MKDGKGKLKKGRNLFDLPLSGKRQILRNNDAIVLKSKSIIYASAWEGDNNGRPNLHVLAIGAVLNFLLFESALILFVVCKRSDL